MWPWGIRTSVSPPVADPRKGGRLSQLDHRAGATNTRRSWFGRGYTTPRKKNHFNHGKLTTGIFSQNEQHQIYYIFTLLLANWQLAFLVRMNNTRYIHFTFGIWQLAIFITINIKPLLHWQLTSGKNRKNTCFQKTKNNLLNYQIQMKIPNALALA